MNYFNDNLGSEKDRLSDVSKNPPQMDYANQFERLDRNLAVTGKGVWLALAILSVLLILFLMWAIFGSLPVYVNGRGVVMSEEGVFVAQAHTNGILRNLKVKVDDYVKEGDVLGEIYNPDVEISLKLAKFQKQVAQKDYDRLQELVNIENEARITALQSQIKAYEDTLQKFRTELPSFKKNYESENELYKVGLERFSAVKQAEEDFIQKKNAINDYQAKLDSAKSELVKGYRTEELTNKEKALIAISENLKKLEVQKKMSTILNPADGKVLSILRQDGTYLEAGTSIVWMEHASNKIKKYLVYAYVSLEAGKKIIPNASVKIALSTVNPDEYGYAEGIVVDVSRYAVSADDLVNTIHNSGLVRFLMEEQPALLQVKILPKVDPANPKKFIWSSGKEPNIDITSGTVGKISIAVEKIRPLYFAFPIQSLKNVP